MAVRDIRVRGALAGAQATGRAGLVPLAAALVAEPSPAATASAASGPRAAHLPVSDPAGGARGVTSTGALPGATTREVAAATDHAARPADAHSPTTARRLGLAAPTVEARAQPPEAFAPSVAIGRAGDHLAGVQRGAIPGQQVSGHIPTNAARRAIETSRTAVQWEAGPPAADSVHKPGGRTETRVRPARHGRGPIVKTPARRGRARLTTNRARHARGSMSGHTAVTPARADLMMRRAHHAGVPTVTLDPRMDGPTVVTRDRRVRRARSIGTATTTGAATRDRWGARCPHARHILHERASSARMAPGIRDRRAAPASAGLTADGSSRQLKQQRNDCRSTSPARELRRGVTPKR